jgi:exosome complex RNA-binding protein Rrp4
MKTDETVEKTLKNMENSVMTIAELKRKLPRHINHKTLMLIINNLEKDNKIFIGQNGITWIHNPNSDLISSIKEGLEL